MIYVQVKWPYLFKNFIKTCAKTKTSCPSLINFFSMYNTKFSNAFANATLLFLFEFDGIILKFIGKLIYEITWVVNKNEW